jgi:hypothetical protein
MVWEISIKEGTQQKTYATQMYSWRFARREPYWTAMSGGCHVGYRRTPRGGTWIGRYRDNATGKRHFDALGPANDIRDADGITVFSFAHACTALEVGHRRASGMEIIGTVRERRRRSRPCASSICWRGWRVVDEGGEADIASRFIATCFCPSYCYSSWYNCNSLLRTPGEKHGKYSTRDLCPKVSKCNS